MVHRKYSGVLGRILELCWNNSLQTFSPSNVLILFTAFYICDYIVTLKSGNIIMTIISYRGHIFVLIHNFYAYASYTRFPNLNDMKSSLYAILEFIVP